MAGEPTRMSTADLRRRLHAAPSAKPIALPEQDAPPATRAPNSRPAEIPQIDPSLFRGTTHDFGTMSDVQTGEPTPLPTARMSGEFRRPNLSHLSAHNGHSGHSGAPRSSTPGQGSKHAIDLDPACALFGGEPLSSHSGSHDLNELRSENAQLQTLLEEMRQLLTEASEQEQKAVGELKIREDQIIELELKLEEMTALAKKPRTSEELEEWSDDLEKESFKIQQEKRLIDADRKQMREDEKALEKQMREMEVSMARERAMLARQEQELKRLSAEIQHELEAVQRGDGALRDRLSVFQRRHSEVMSSQPAGGMPMGGSHAGIPAPPMISGPGSYGGFSPSPVASPTPTPTPKKNDTTGLLRKIFRGNGSEQ